MFLDHRRFVFVREVAKSAVLTVFPGSAWLNPGPIKADDAAAHAGRCPRWVQTNANRGHRLFAQSSGKNCTGIGTFCLPSIPTWRVISSND